MRNNTAVPDLTFSKQSLESPKAVWDLSFLLYRGGSKAFTRRVGRMIADGELGRPLSERLELAVKIHEALNAKLVGGGSSFTTESCIRAIRDMFIWVDENSYPLDLECAQNAYLSWTDSLVHRYQVVKNLSQSSAYSQASFVGNVLDTVLQRNTPLISISRIRLPLQNKGARGTNAEKQSLAETFEFGYFLQDICDALSVEVVMKGPLPIRIPLRRGGELVEWSAYHRPNLIEYINSLPPITNDSTESQKLRLASPGFKDWEADGTFRTRYPLVNRRIEAELLMFIGQTGMNLAQAHQLKLRHFSYFSYIDGYLVRDRKERRGGEVIFEIFKEYKPHFERYLDWRRQLFPESDALFPFTGKGGRSFNLRPQFNLRIVCKRINLKFVTPQELRNTRVNWLLRRSGDADLTASMAQHQKETLLKIYERPSQQRAMVEIIRFWSEHDPTLSPTHPIGPGQCDGKPVLMKSAPDAVLAPDCIRPSGCMWCEHHRDIDSLDYVWSLACFRHLKIIELSRWGAPQQPNDIHPAQHVIDRISEKLRWFAESTTSRAAWLEEALERVEEGNYHPEWCRRIAAMEGSS